MLYNLLKPVNTLDLHIPNYCLLTTFIIGVTSFAVELLEVLTSA